MSDTQDMTRERYGRQHLPRLFSEDAHDARSEVRDRYLGLGIALGCGLGVAIGCAFGVAFGNLAFAIGMGICIGTALGLTIGWSVGDQRAKALQEPSDNSVRR